MRAVRANGAGGTEVLEIVSMPDPEPAEGQLLVRVAAAGINRADIAQRQGTYDPPPGASHVLGLEVAGEVVACGPAVEGWSVGDTVCAVIAGGGYAELALVPAACALPVPSTLSLTEAAAIPEVFTTVHDNLVTRGRLAVGERVLIHGGGSGIGTAAIQIARDRGCEIFVTVGSPEKIAACRELGADHVILYRDVHFPDEIARLTDGAGVDVILDIVGAAYLGPNLSSLRDEGRLVVIATLGGRLAELDLYELHLRRLTVTGSTLRRRTVAEKAVVADRLRAEVLPGFETGRFRPVIHRVLPLEEVAQAHQLLESSTHVGKVVLAIASVDA